jgi:hypothetical protein
MRFGMLRAMSLNFCQTDIYISVAGTTSELSTFRVSCDQRISASCARLPVHKLLVYGGTWEAIEGRRWRGDWQETYISITFIIDLAQYTPTWEQLMYMSSDTGYDLGEVPKYTQCRHWPSCFENRTLREIITKIRHPHHPSSSYHPVALRLAARTSQRSTRGYSLMGFIYVYG